MSKTSEVERRQHKRLELTNLVAYKSFDIEAVTETINISAGGMKIQTEFPIGKNEMLELTLGIGEDEFKSEARVIYCNPRGEKTYEIGLSFEGTAEQHLELLNRYLSSQS